MTFREYYQIVFDFFNDAGMGAVFAWAIVFFVFGGLVSLIQKVW